VSVERQLIVATVAAPPISRVATRTRACCIQLCPRCPRAHRCTAHPPTSPHAGVRVPAARPRDTVNILAARAGVREFVMSSFCVVHRLETQLLVTRVRPLLTKEPLTSRDQYLPSRVRCAGHTRDGKRQPGHGFDRPALSDQNSFFANRRSVCRCCFASTRPDTVAHQRCVCCFLCAVQLRGPLNTPAYCPPMRKALRRVGGAACGAGACAAWSSGSSGHPGASPFALPCATSRRRSECDPPQFPGRCPARCRSSRCTAMLSLPAAGSLRRDGREPHAKTRLTAAKAIQRKFCARVPGSCISCRKSK